MKRGTLWPIGVATILAATVTANIWLMVVANDDPSFAIERDYYTKAVQWDSTMAQERRNAALRWRLEPSLAAYSMRDGALLHVTLTDSSGAAIPDATVTVAALYNARANAIIDRTLARDRAGYSVRLPVRHRGAWELRFDVRRGPERFTTVARVDAEPARTSGGS